MYAGGIVQILHAGHARGYVLALETCMADFRSEKRCAGRHECLPAAAMATVTRNLI